MIETTQELCSEVARLATSQRHVLTQRPWNRFEPENSLWWLVPSADWPAHRFAKLFFDWDEENRGSFFCGLNVEKGVDRRMKGLTKRYNIMDEEWAWHSFVARLENGSVRRLIESRLADPYPTWKLVVSSSLVGGMRDFDPLSEETRSTRTRYVWTWNTDGQLWSLIKRHDPLRLTPELSRLTQLEQIAEFIPGIKDIDFLWVDLYLGVLAGPKVEGGCLAESDASSLWLKYLSCFESLV